MKTLGITTWEDTNPVCPKKPTCIAERPRTSWPTSHHWSGLWTGATMCTSGQRMQSIHKIKEINRKITLLWMKELKKAINIEK